MEKMLNFQDHTLYVYDLEVIDSRMYMMREGDEILLIADGSHIVWVVGYRLSAYYYTTEGTDLVIIETTLSEELLSGLLPEKR